MELDGAKKTHGVHTMKYEVLAHTFNMMASGDASLTTVLALELLACFPPIGQSPMNNIGIWEGGRWLREL